MLVPRPTKLRSQRDINLWRIPLQLSLAATALFGLTLIPDILDKYGVIRIPSWLTMGSIDDFAERPPLEGNWFDIGGRLRVWMPPVRLERLVKLAFDQIRQASATTPAVLIRLLDAICRLALRLPEACRQVLSEQADAIRESACAGRA
jgi:uncharacterized membrane protein